MIQGTERCRDMSTVDVDGTLESFDVVQWILGQNEREPRYHVRGSDSRIFNQASHAAMDIHKRT